MEIDLPVFPSIYIFSDSGYVHQIIIFFGKIIFFHIQMLHQSCYFAE